MRLFRVTKAGEFVSVNSSMVRQAAEEYSDELDTEYHLDVVLATIKDENGNFKNAVVVTIHETLVEDPATGELVPQGCEKGVEEEIGQMIREELGWTGEVIINSKQHGPTREEKEKPAGKKDDWMKLAPPKRVEEEEEAPAAPTAPPPTSTAPPVQQKQQQQSG